MSIVNTPKLLHKIPRLSDELTAFGNAEVMSLGHQELEISYEASSWGLRPSGPDFGPLAVPLAEQSVGVLVLGDQILPHYLIFLVFLRLEDVAPAANVYA